jgi:hypothetical protein
MKPKTPCPLWSPRITYVWERDQLRAWYHQHGHFATHGGHMWTLETRSLKCGLYQVTVVPYDTNTRGPQRS